MIFEGELFTRWGFWDQSGKCDRFSLCLVQSVSKHKLSLIQSNPNKLSVNWDNCTQSLTVKFFNLLILRANMFQNFQWEKKKYSNGKSECSMNHTSHSYRKEVLPDVPLASVRGKQMNEKGKCALSFRDKSKWKLAAQTLYATWFCCVKFWVANASFDIDHLWH